MRASKKVMGVLILGVLAFSLTLIVGCGGGGGGTVSEGTGGSTPTLAGTISGTAIKGPVANAAVTCFSINADGTMGGQIGSGQTDGQGNFSVSVGDYSGPVFCQMTGGSYMDEATGTNMNMGQNDSLTCVIPSMTAGSMMDGIQMTPLTSMAQNMVKFMLGGMTPANITAANNAMARYFSVNDILRTPLNDMMGDANIMMGGGMMGGGTALPSDAGTKGLASAMVKFVQSPMNRSGVTVPDMKALIDKLNASNGTIQ